MEKIISNDLVLREKIVKGKYRFVVLFGRADNCAVHIAEDEINILIGALQAFQQSVQPTLLESPRSGSHSCTCALCKGSHTTLPQSG